MTNRKKVSGPELGAAMRDFFGHVQEHDPNGVRAAFCLVANAPEGDNPHMHVCSFGGGDPQILAELVVMAIDEGMQIPEFSEHFHMLLQQRAIAKAVEALSAAVQEKHAMDEAAPIAESIIAKAKGTLQ